MINYERHLVSRHEDEGFGSLDNLNQAIGEVIALTMTSGSRFIGVNKGFDSKKQIVVLNRAGVDKGDFPWYAVMEIPEGYIAEVESLGDGEIIDYMSDRREPHRLSGTAN